MSACAARRWHGSNIDRRRFIELLANHSPAEANTSWVSIAALVNKNFIDEADTPFAHGQTRIFRDDEIDLPLADASSRYPQVRVRDLKQCTFAALIYKWLRCGYAHEYAPNPNVTQVAASRHEARVSYIGRVDGPRIRRMTSFHFDYLMGLAQHHASQDADRPSPHPVPVQWWIETETL
jgi:hypothetical protein